MRSLFLAVGSLALLGACSEQTAPAGTSGSAATSTDLLILAEDPQGVGSLQRYLADGGFRTRTLPLLDVTESTAISPRELVVVAGKPGSRFRPRGLHKTLWGLLKDKRVIAMGERGYELLGVGKLRIGDRHGWHNSRLPKIVRIPKALQETAFAKLLTEPHAVAAETDDTGALVTVYGGEGKDVLSHAAIFQGKKGFPATVLPIGMEGAKGRHWIICKQGTHVLWGIDADFDRITEAGAHLFVNLCVAMKRAASE